MIPGFHMTRPAPIAEGKAMDRRQRDAVYARLADIANLADDRQDIVDGANGEQLPDDWMKVSQWAHEALANLPEDE